MSREWPLNALVTMTVELEKRVQKETYGKSFFETLKASREQPKSPSTMHKESLPKFNERKEEENSPEIEWKPRKETEKRSTRTTVDPSF